MKSYKRPMAELVTIDCIGFIAASPAGPELKFTSEQADNNVEALSNKQEHSWGSLWNK